MCREVIFILLYYFVAICYSSKSEEGVNLPNHYVNRWRIFPHHRSFRSIHLPNGVKNNHVIGTKQSHWTKWSPWGECSKKCGGGVRIKTRICKGGKMPYQYKETSRDTKYKCKGDARKFGACNTEPCLSTHTFGALKYKARQLQCSAHNKIPYFSELHEWLPYLRGLDECKLNCRPKKFRMFKSFGNVADGTVCGKTHGFHCINGQCQRKIIQHMNETEIIATTSQPQIVKKKKKKRPIYIIKPMIIPVEWTQMQRSFRMKKFVTDTVKAFIIPMGAVNVSIEEVEPSKNFLILKTMYKDVINGRSLVKKSRDIYFDKTTIKYEDGNDNSGKEKIFIKGPLRRNLFVDVQYNGSATNIDYEYSIPMENRNYLEQVSRRRFYTQQQLPSKYHQHFNRHHPSLTFPQNPHINQRIAHHLPTHRPNANTNEINEEQGKENQKIIYKWHIGGFTNCTLSCGGGEQEIVYKCFELKGRNGMFVNDENCKDKRRPNSSKRVCNIQPCPYKWKTYPWGSCSEQCGIERKRKRKVRCTKLHHIAGRRLEPIVDAKFCERLEKPSTEERCTYKPCNYRWYSTPWTVCSKTCDRGTQIRVVQCKHKNGFVMPDSMCDQAYRPDSTRDCLLKYCKVGWFASEWNECSSKCGMGRQERKVVCSSSSGDVLDERQCNKQTKPIGEQSCKGNSCDEGVWVTTDWTKCSTECGSGKQFRSVFCLKQKSDHLINVVSDYKCNAKDKPIEMKLCHQKECQPLWHTNKWDQCNCNDGYQRRYRVCLTSDGRKARGCMWSSRPNTLKKCSKTCVKAGTSVEINNRQAWDASKVSSSTKEKIKPKYEQVKNKTSTTATKTITITSKPSKTLPNQFYTTKTISIKPRTRITPVYNVSTTETSDLRRTTVKNSTSIVTLTKTALTQPPMMETSKKEISAKKKTPTRPPTSTAIADTKKTASTQAISAKTTMTKIPATKTTSTRQLSTKSSTTTTTSTRPLSTKITSTRPPSTKTSTTRTTTAQPTTTVITSTMKKTSTQLTTTRTTSTQPPKTKTSTTKTTSTQPSTTNTTTIRTTAKRRCFNLRSGGFCFAVKMHRMCRISRLNRICCRTCNQR